MKRMVFFCLYFICTVSPAQVGINTTAPSEASVLHINSTSDGLTFGGLMLPKVTLTQRDAIATGVGDDGLLVLAVDGDNRCLQIYNEGQNAWVNIFCYNATTPVTTDFIFWEMEGLSDFGPSPYSPTYVHPQVTAGGLTRGSGITTNGTVVATHAWGADGWDGVFNRDDAIAAGKYVYFSIAPALGQTLNLTAVQPYNVRRSATGPRYGVWQYSLDGLNFYDITSTIEWGANTTAVGNPQPAIDLSVIPALQNVSYPNEIVFRIVCWDATNNQGTWYINNIPYIGDLIISGH